MCGSNPRTAVDGNFRLIVFPFSWGGLAGERPNVVAGKALGELLIC